uniref:F-box domain-containing protein n=1 Tax=Heligmosomoides polygyrus TaxID=6339 RepID=A0A8L8KUE9_HELPZ
LPREDRRHSLFGTMPKHTKNCGMATITFKKAEDAAKARNAPREELKFYEQYMVVSAYVSKRKGGKGVVLTDDTKDEMYDLSRASSNQSLASTTMSNSGYEIAPNALERIAAYLSVNDTIRMERVSKRCMEASMKAILRRAGVHLKSLDLDLSGVRASWEALCDLGESLTNLKRLTYRDMDNASDKAFWYLIKGCGRCLQFIDLRGCRRLHGRCFRLFGNQLEQLYLDGCLHIDEMALEDLCTCAGGLKELRVNDCYKITDENLSMISRMLCDLRVFTLCGDRFERLTTAGLSHISNMTALHLKTLSLSNAGSDQTLTGKGITAIAQLTELEQLDLSSLAAVRSGVLLEVAYSCRSISLLQLRNCVYLSDDGVKGLVRAKKLRHLDLSGSILITNESVQEFIKGFPTEEGKKPVTIVVGGTAADPARLSMRGSRVVVDFSDYTSILSMQDAQNASFKIGKRFY